MNLLRHQTFRREEDVRESFQRLHPLRIATMHARLLTQDDEVFLSVEVKRIPLWALVVLTLYSSGSDPPALEVLPTHSSDCDPPR